MWTLAGNFVGRQALLTRILKVDIKAGPPGRFFVVPGIPGSGKTELLNQLWRAVEKEEGSPGGRVIHIHGENYEVLGSRPGAQAFDPAAEFRQFKTLLQDSLPDAVDEASADTLNWADTRPSLGGRSRAREETGNDPGQLVELATGALSSLARTLAGQERRLLVLVDDFDLFAQRPLGDWVLRWLAGIRGADIVVTHLPTAAEQLRSWPSHAITLPLGNLDRDEVRRYLASREQVDPDEVGSIIGPIWDFTGGHPRALVLVADLIRESERPGDAVRAIRQVGAAESDRAGQLEDLVERIFRASDDTGLQHALYSLCVTRYFDTALLTRLPGVSELHAETLIEEIRQFSFVTEDGTHGFFTIRPFVRDIGQAKHTDGARRGEIHAAAAAYFHDLILKEVEDDQNSTEAWYHLEDNRFQTLKKEWLYHLSQLTGRQRRMGRLEIARLFLDGFWWWGCYAPFPFCEEILADWMSETTDGSQESKEDREWGQALRGVYDAFPRGNRLERAKRAELITVRRYLRQLWDRGGLGNQEDNPEARHVRGIVDVLLADVLRYLKPADPRVDETLDDAAALLAEDDEYFVAWIDFQRGDLHLQRGQWEQAKELARQSAQRHAKFDDHELIANFHRVHADALWACGEAGPAFDGYARAVLHAYATQVDGSPDAYTNAFQQEMTDRCVERMTELRAAADDDGGGEAVLRGACARIRAFFGEYWDAVAGDAVGNVSDDVLRALADGVPAEAAGMLFPALAPEVDTDLTRAGTEWEIIRHDVLGEMRDELDALPGTPLPSAAG
jgi:hypothetical protein